MNRKAAVGTAIVALVALGGVFVARNRERPYDPSFDARVNDPAYAAGGPVVLYDEGHLNTHTTKGGYKPLADLIRADGYELRVTQESFSVQTLDGTAILAIVLARGANDANDDPAFASEEIAAVEQWVRSGGSLLLVTDHWPYGKAAATLAAAFDVQFGAGLVQDLEHHDPERGDSHLVFSAENGLLGDHAILHGRGQAERVRRVLTFTGQSMLGPPAAVRLLALSDTATELPPTKPRVTKDGDDVRVDMEYGEPASAAGRAQGLALEHGAGRMVILGEAGMLRAQQDGRVMVGMNVAGYDNRQLALNILHWLSRVL